MTQDRTPAAASPLFPDDATRHRIDRQLGEHLHAARLRIADGSVAPTLDMDEFRLALSMFDFVDPQSPDAVLPWTIAQLERGATHVTHPRYFGLFNPAPSFPAECAERIVAQFNPQLASATTSPAPVAIEAHVITAIGRRAGYPGPIAGHFTTGGSEANFTALICALLKADPRYADEGVRAFAGQPLFYVSADCHLAWHKIALQAGLGHAAMRSVPTDGAGRMDAGVLNRMIGDDRIAGHVPVMIVATAGTTVAGMVDPLPACGRIARSRGVWLHVDAAWGGGAIASRRLAGSLAGIENADSLTIDAHKWFATTMACGMFVTRDTQILPRAFQVTTVFMPSNAPQQDPYVASLQWSRRFLGLRLFLTLATAGWTGVARHVEHAVQLCDQIAQEMMARGWTVANDSRLAVLCLQPPPGAPPVRDIVGRIVQSGLAWISATVFEGRDVVRICVTHGQTSSYDAMALVHALDAEAAPTNAPIRQDGELVSP